MYYCNFLFSFVSLENFPSLTQSLKLFPLNGSHVYQLVLQAHNFDVISNKTMDYTLIDIVNTDNNLRLEFPVTEKHVIKCKPYMYIVELYCLCSMPYWRTDKIGLRMAACKNCKRWFHRKCGKIPAAVFSTGKQWCCLNCRYLIG